MNNYPNIINMSNNRHVQQAQKSVTGRQNGWSAILKNDAQGNMLNNTGTVHYQDFLDLTEDVIEARRFANVGIQDLVAAGLTTESDINMTIIQYESKNTFSAEVSMNGSNRLENQSNYVTNFIPQPIFHTDFFIPWRQEGFSYKQSDGVAEAVYVVNEEQDRVLFMGADLGVRFNGNAVELYGYTNHPATIASTISDWALETNSDLISKEAITLVGKLFQGGKAMEPNSVMMYVATDIWTNLQNDYATEKGDRTINERIMAISEIGGVKPQKDLPAGGVVLVEMRPRTVQLSVALMPTAVPWVKSHDLEDGRFTIYSSMAVKIKADQEGNGGILYATK